VSPEGEEDKTVHPDPVIVTPLLAAACILFIWSCYRRFSLVTVGTPVDRFSRVWHRLKGVLLFALLQKRVLNRPFGLNHLLIIWSFLILIIANLEFVVAAVFPAARLSLLPAALYYPLRTAFDLASFFALCAVVLALVRKRIAPPHQGARTIEAFAILSLIGLLLLAYLGVHAAEIAMGMERAADAMPVSSALAALVAGVPGLPLESFALGSWWLHAGVLLFLLNYLPYSKQMHILAAIPNCYFRELEPTNTLPREDFTKGNSFGAGRIDRFTWKELFDSFACTGCGRCENACPAAGDGKPLNPRKLMHAIKENLLVNGPLLRRGASPAIPLIGTEPGSIDPDAIWSCTSCGACHASCPVFIEKMQKVIKMRRHLVQMDADFPEELQHLFENMEQRSNPWGMAPGQRGDWANRREVKSFDAESTEYLLYVGCAGSFDSRSNQVTLAMAEILDAAGIFWGILGQEEKCCGESMRQLGNEYLFDKMARENVALFKEKRVQKVITQCPHCFNTLKNDYRQYGLELEVVSHVEFIEELMAQGLLDLDPQSSDSGELVFHDSCYLGRHNGIYRAPRSVIEQATGSAPAEMVRNREESFCCGAGGGRVWMQEHLEEKIYPNRLNEALSASPDTICVTCPHCMTMMEAGLKDCSTAKTRVKDVAELVAERLVKA
jgi:Fe-S oxidoreductase